MGQSLGQLKDRYIFAGEGADQLCGRMVCRLPYSDETFGILRPHFSNETLDLMTEKFWMDIVPGYENYPDSFKSIFPILLASLIHHKSFLRNNFPYTAYNLLRRGDTERNIGRKRQKKYSSKSYLLCVYV